MSRISLLLKHMNSRCSSFKLTDTAKQYFEGTHGTVIHDVSYVCALCTDQNHVLRERMQTVVVCRVRTVLEYQMDANGVRTVLTVLYLLVLVPTYLATYDETNGYFLSSRLK